MRRDGKRLKHADPMYTVAAHIMDRRSDAMNMITIDIPLEPIQKYIIQKRKEGISISHIAVILAAYVQTVAEYPEINRFVVNKNLYARNEIAVGRRVDPLDGTHLRNHDRTHPYGNVGLQPSGP